MSSSDRNGIRLQLLSAKFRRRKNLRNSHSNLLKCPQLVFLFRSSCRFLVRRFMHIQNDTICCAIARAPRRALLKLRITSAESANVCAPLSELAQRINSMLDNNRYRHCNCMLIKRSRSETMKYHFHFHFSKSSIAPR